MKLRPTDIETAFMRVVEGESVNSVARGLNVTEGALRWRFNRLGLRASEVRRVALVVCAARMAYEALSERDRLAVDRLVAQLRKPAKQSPAHAGPYEHTKVSPRPAKPPTWPAYPPRHKTALCGLFHA